MIQLLYTVIFGEAVVLFLVIVKNPSRMLVTMTLDRIKRGRGPVVVKTLVAVMFVLMVTSTHSIYKIHWRSEEVSGITPTDQVLASKNMLEASLMGFIIFLTFIIDRMHHYIWEIRGMRKIIEQLKQQNANPGSTTVQSLNEEISSLREKLNQRDGSGAGSNDVVKSLKREISALNEKVKHLESEVQAKNEAAKIAEANALALKKQSEGFLLEYDRLLEDNQNLRNQLQSFERVLSHSDSKKSI